MAQFVFSLEPVLDHRLRLEEEAQKRVSAIRIRLDECQGAIARLTETQRQATAEMYECLAQGKGERRRLLYANFLQGAGDEIERRQVVETRFETELTAARELLVEAMRNRQIIEEVKKVEFKEFQYAEQLEERKLYDDLGRRVWMQGQKEKLAVEGKE